MKIENVLAMLLFALVFVGLQTGSASAATKIDQFMVIHPGGGQNDDADIYKTYQFTINHIFIADKGYNWNSKRHSYYYNGYQWWIDLNKVTKTKLKITNPKIEGSRSSTYVNTKHTAAYYYWFILKPQLKKGWNLDIIPTIFFMDLQYLYLNYFFYNKKLV